MTRTGSEEPGHLTGKADKLRAMYREDAATLPELKRIRVENRAVAYVCGQPQDMQTDLMALAYVLNLLGYSDAYSDIGKSIEFLGRCYNQGLFDAGAAAVLRAGVPEQQQKEDGNGSTATVPDGH